VDNAKEVLAKAKKKLERTFALLLSDTTDANECLSTDGDGTAGCSYPNP
jgi:hypothetical protein